MSRLKSKGKICGIAAIVMGASLVGGIVLASPRILAVAQESSSYVELYSPLDVVEISVSNNAYLGVSVKDSSKTESGKGLCLDYKTGCTSSVSATIPMTIQKNVDNFEGLAFWVDIPETVDEYSFTMYIVKSVNAWQCLTANTDITLIEEDGTVTEQVSVANDYKLNGFTGWVVLPENAYEDAEPNLGGQYDVVMEIKTSKTQAMALTLGSFGYYTDYYKFLCEYANVEGVAKQALKDIDCYITEIKSLRVLTDRQVKLRDKMLVDYVNLKENFKTMSADDQMETALQLKEEYQARVEDCLYGDIKQSNFIMSFAMMSDMHFSNTFFNPTFRNALEDARALNLDLAAAIALGDLSDNGVSISMESLGQLDDYYNWIDAYEYKNSKGESIPIMSILGNHDIRGAYLDPDGHYPTSSYEPAVQMYLEREGVDSLQHDTWINGYHFIFLNADRYERDDGYLNAQSIEWLDETLSENEDGRPIFVMIHQPVGEVKTATDAKMTFEEVIARHPSAIVSSGHKHHAFGENKIVQDGNGTYINQPSMMDENIPGYYYVEVYEDGVVYRARDEINNKWHYGSYVVVHNEDKFSNNLFSAASFDSSVLTTTNVTASVEKADNVSGKALKLVGAIADENVSVPVYATGTVENYAGYALYIESATAVKVAFGGVSLKANAKYYALQSTGLVERTTGANGEITADGWVVIPKETLDGNGAPSKTTKLTVTVGAAQTIYLDRVCYYFDLDDFVSATTALSCVYYNEGIALSVGTAKFGDSVVVPENPTKEETNEFSFAFSGWDLDGDGEADALPTVQKGDIHATALYTATIRKYTYTFYAADGTTVLSSATANYGTAITAPELANLYGWDLDGDGAVEGLPATLKSNINAVAIFIDGNSTLEYSFNDGNGHVYKSGQIATGEIIIAPTDPISENANEVFVGWDLDNDGYSDELPENGTINKNLNAVALFYDASMIEVVNGGTTTGWSKEGNHIALSDKVHTASSTGTAMHLALNKNGATSGTMYAKLNLTYDRQPEGIAVWMDSSTMSAFTMRVWKTWQPKQSIEYNGDYLYFYDENGTVTQAAGWREVSVPANFKGWMVIPMSAFTNDGTNSTIVAGDYLRLGFPISENGNTNLSGDIYFGETIKFYCSIETFNKNTHQRFYEIKDYDGSTIALGILGEGKVAKALANPVRTDWQFVGWDIDGDGEADAVPENWGRYFTATAVYTRDFTYKFVDKDGNVIFEKTATCDSLILPPFRYLEDDPNYENLTIDYGGYVAGMRLTEDMTFVIKVEGQTTEKPDDNGSSDDSNDSSNDGDNNGTENGNQSGANVSGCNGCNSSLGSGLPIALLMIIGAGFVIRFSKKGREE